MGSWCSRTDCVRWLTLARSCRESLLYDLMYDRCVTMQHVRVLYVCV